jgi:uncharacterized membrane protein YeaQ/YmgE (transglycosylase-associated protein family)
MDFLLLILIGVIAGWLAGKIVKGYRLGLLGSLVVGVLGAFLGAFILQFIGIPPDDLFGLGISAVVGAVVLLYLIQSLRRI